MKHINLIAYDNYEIFDSDDDLKKYCHNKLSGIEKQINFIKSEFTNKIKMVELGSGNGKLPIGLAKKELLDSAIAYEISQHRHNFAEKWVETEKINNIQLVNSSFIETSLNEHENLDLVIGVDLIFHFIDPIEKNGDIKVLKNIYNWLKLGGGKLILEFNHLNQLIDLNRWEEFDNTDPWRFSLWDCKYDELNNYLSWDKIFISREGGKIDKTSIILKLYTPNEIVKILNSIGFKHIRLYSNWDKLVYGENNLEYIIIAEKL